MLDRDFGVPLGGQRCRETAQDSGVFVREWTKAVISLDTNTNAANIIMKEASSDRVSHTVQV
eukprot:SAG22_NODE_22095_length_251_cov_1.019737_1_plen_61_part_10